jgi:hypothetical protein
MRCPPRAMSPVMNAMISCSWRHAMQPRACVAEKRPLTNRIRRHFARIKAAGSDCGPCGYRPFRRSTEDMSRRPPGDINRHKDDAQKISTEGGVGGDVYDAQDTSATLRRTSATPRRRRGRKPGRSCRPPCRCRFRRGRANDVRFRPRSPARRCDRPSGPSAPHG